MNAMLIRLGITVAIVLGLYGSGYLHATVRASRTAEIRELKAERDAAKEVLAMVRRANESAAARIQNMEAARASLEEKVRDYEDAIKVGPVVVHDASGACAVGDDGARRLRSILAPAPRR